eukprot:TRINITY_DN5977_c0_g1_i2.p1 TRINITY_DN5977_c0_g1~~TRINITY_DN5977_c0_g1_i2.p1  ORF type:complete len:229 (-),score=49.67 TRINITY_DN5977_c0_g1_i2:105-791(-)
MGTSNSKSRRATLPTSRTVILPPSIPAPAPTSPPPPVLEVLPVVPKRKVLMTSVALDTTECTMDEQDFLSHSAMELVLIVLSYLTISDLCRVQQLSKFWYLTGKENQLWKKLLERECLKWNAMVNEPLLVKLKADVNSERWKKICVNYMMLKVCKQCKKVYRESKNNPNACRRHSGIRDIIEGRGVPSGVYWTCCLVKDKTNPGCANGPHIELQEETTESSSSSSTSA